MVNTTWFITLITLYKVCVIELTNVILVLEAL